MILIVINIKTVGRFDWNVCNFCQYDKNAQPKRKHPLIEDITEESIINETVHTVHDCDGAKNVKKTKVVSD